MRTSITGSVPKRSSVLFNFLLNPFLHQHSSSNACDNEGSIKCNSRWNGFAGKKVRFRYPSDLCAFSSNRLQFGRSSRQLLPINNLFRWFLCFTTGILRRTIFSSHASK
eukprot:Gb_28948 [translate_table: standard]